MIIVFNAVTLALNLDNIDNHPERVSKIKPFIEKYNWEDIDCPSTSKDWKNLNLTTKSRLIFYTCLIILKK